MFEIGRTYRFFTMSDDYEDGVTYISGKVTAVALPLIKVEHSESDVEIINTHAPQFVRAELLSEDRGRPSEDIPDDLLAPPI